MGIINEKSGNKEYSGSLLSAPISSNLSVWGVCYLDSAKTDLFSLEDLEFFMATARETGLIVENLKLQEQLLKSERLATIGKLTSAISHEIRNRLVLLNGIEFIGMKYNDDPDVKQFTEMVITGQRRALALVEEIRAFACNRKENFEKTRMPIVPTIERAISILKLDPTVAKRNLNFQYEIAPDCYFNEEKIEQVIINLVRNAVQATKDHGVINLNLEIAENNMILKVSDDGMGIPAQDLESIWEPFFSTKGEEGTGLGLEICRRIIEAHGGSITCQTNLGEGSTFIVMLPLENPDQDTVSS
jgi:signal transduction histidine kinase